MTGIYRKPDPPIPPGATWHERIQDRSYIPTRIAAAWNILRGRPTIYRCQITSGPDTTHLGPLPDTGPARPRPGDAPPPHPDPCRARPRRHLLETGGAVTVVPGRPGPQRVNRKAAQQYAEALVDLGVGRMEWTATADELRKHAAQVIAAGLPYQRILPDPSPGQPTVVVVWPDDQQEAAA